MSGSVGERVLIDLPDVATRVDQEGGYREEISFPLVGDTPVFSVAYWPRRAPEAGVVVCPPIMMELLKNYRQEVLLARMLASRGIAVQRFHYRGTGHSEGVELEVSADTMIGDAQAAGERLQQQGIQKLAFLGIRWGAQVAAVAARGYPGVPLVLWEPVVEAARYFRELIRARLVREAKDARFARPSADGEDGDASPQASRWKEEMASEGHADILGYALSRRFYEGVKTQHLGDILAQGGGRPVLLVQMSRQGALRPELVDLKRAIESTGGTCEAHLIREEPGWMFDSRRMKELPRLLQTSADWLTTRIGSSHA